MSYQRDFGKKLDVAVIGAGSHGYRNILPAMNFLPVRVRAVCDINPQLARVTAAQYGAIPFTSSRDLFRDQPIDAVFISVSPALHPELAVEAFGAGVNVWMEKPPALRTAAINDVIRARKGKVAVVGFKKAFTPAFEKVIEIFGQPDAGPLRTLLAEYPMSIPIDGADVLATSRATNWLANGCHPVSMLLAVGGTAESIAVHRGRHGGGVAVLEFSSGAVGNLHLADGAPGYNTRERYSFIGNGIQVEVENSRRVSVHRGIPFDYAQTISYAPAGLNSGSIVWEPQNNLGTLENQSIFTQGFYGSMRYFCDCVLDGRAAQRGSLEFAQQVMRVYEAALLSHGQFVKLGED